jgi:ribonuclease P protein component
MALAKAYPLRQGAQRLRARADFERVRRDGHSWRHRLLVLVARRNELGVTRVGVAAGKRVGSAVARNRAKRLMRQAMRIFSPRVTPGWDLLLIARAPIAPVKMQDVVAALEPLLCQANLISGP